MRIITPGTKPDQKVYRGQCQYCDCVFEFERKEARSVDDQRDGAALVIKCPTCEHELWLAP